MKMKLWCEPEGSVATRFGVYKRKYTLRALCRSIAFIALIGGFMLYNILVNEGTGVTVTATSTRSLGEVDLEDLKQSTGTSPATDILGFRDNYHKYRYLESEVMLQDCDDIEKADPGWLSAFYAIGVLYMFLALAIICDEFFVPALEEMSSSRRLNLSEDVAGATLMAAGGSAPELFSSLFGTFKESEIGFGTIIGSAVFNVLFVIAMCSICAKEILTLTWWPLFRDSFCYAIGLAVLTIFVAVTSPDVIEMWEAIVLLVMYLFYILVMWKNEAIYEFITGKKLVCEEDDEDNSTGEEINETAQQEARVESETHVMLESETNVETNVEREQEQEQQVKHTRNDSMRSSRSVASMSLQRNTMSSCKFDFRWQGTFRAGILRLLRNPHCWVETAGVGIVAKIAGDADQVFKRIDENGDGEIDKHELKKLFEILDHPISEAELDQVFDALDVEKTGAISEQEFQHWYTTSAELIKSQVRNVFDSLDTNKSGTIDKEDLKALLIQLDPIVTDEDVDRAIEDMYKHGSMEEITFEEFSEWYEKSIIYERQKQRVEEDMRGVWESLKPPFGEGWLAWVQFIVVFPLVFVMVVTIPDVRIPGRGKWCYLSFFLSVAWIGVFSYLMVDWATIIGNTLGIPQFLLGVTVIAAGTSVPDLLSSVIVARRGRGDMAVSSSIGSNIFDILVGLPIPWILYTAWPSTPDIVVIGSDNIFISLSILLGMLIFVIAGVHCQGWKLTKTLGSMMLVFYFLFLVQAIVLELPFETCI